MDERNEQAGEVKPSAEQPKQPAAEPQRPADPPLLVSAKEIAAMCGVSLRTANELIARMKAKGLHSPVRGRYVRKQVMRILPELDRED